MEKTIYKKQLVAYKDGEKYWHSIVQYVSEKPSFELPADSYRLRSWYETNDLEVEDLVCPALKANQRVSAKLLVKTVNREAKRKKQEEIIKLLAEYGVSVVCENGHFLSKIPNIELSNEKFTTTKEIPIEVEYIVHVLEYNKNSVFERKYNETDETYPMSYLETFFTQFWDSSRYVDCPTMTVWGTAPYRTTQGNIVQNPCRLGEYRSVFPEKYHNTKLEIIRLLSSIKHKGGWGKFDFPDEAYKYVRRQLAHYFVGYPIADWLLNFYKLNKVEV